MVEGDLVGILAAVVGVVVEEDADGTAPAAVTAAAFFCPALAAASAPSWRMVWFRDDSAGLAASLSLDGSAMEI